MIFLKIKWLKKNVQVIFHTIKRIFQEIIFLKASGSTHFVCLK